jgi:hypothetical protein
MSQTMKSSMGGDRSDRDVRVCPWLLRLPMPINASAISMIRKIR